ncbi:hypothetical protein KY331_05470 [Candidatus Woesearchaeota archaeon]|nr:hypothetical protein [Candidatus Woesearchaeota archaeon]
MERLEQLMQGFVKKNVHLSLRNFNDMDSPVQCSSDIQISPDKDNRPNIIKKTKKLKKRAANPIKMLWEYFQYEALSRVFTHYQVDNEAVNVVVPKPYAVMPKDYTLFTEFMPGFILKIFGKKMDKGVVVMHYNGDEMPAECSVAFHLGYISRIKEIEGIYHSDFDLRHIIYDVEGVGISMFDLENTRFVGDGKTVVGETAFMKRLWFDFATDGRGCSREELERHYQEGRETVKRPTTPRYRKTLEEVGEEYGVRIKFNGMIDKVDVKLQKPKIRR